MIFHSERKFIFSAPPGFLDPSNPDKVQLVFRCPAAFSDYIKALRSHGLPVTFDGPFKAVYVRPLDVQKRIDEAPREGAVFFGACVVAPPESLNFETAPVFTEGLC